MTLGHDGPGLESSALRCSPVEDEAISFRKYMFFFLLYNLISSARLYRANLDG